MATKPRKTRKQRWLNRLNIALPIVATAAAAAQAALPELHGLISPWAYAGASVVSATIVRALTVVRIDPDA